MKKVTDLTESEAIEEIKRNNNMMWLSLNYAGESAQHKRQAILDAIKLRKIEVSNFAR
jgi:hypothetical protein